MRFSYRKFESHSLRQLALSRRSRWQFSPVVEAVSNSNSGLPTGPTALLFSETPVSLRTSVLLPFDMVLEIRSFRVTCELQRKEVRPLRSDKREPPISKLIRHATVFPASLFSLRARAMPPATLLVDHPRPNANNDARSVSTERGA
jgi:hypothetical protein